MTKPTTHRDTITTCPCGFTSKPTTPGLAAYALRQHSCDRWTSITETKARTAARRATVDRTPKPCRHKKTQHVHGTHACYVLDKCRCHDCSPANAHYEKQRVRQQAYGRWNGLTDAQPARDHVNNLRAQGLGLKRVAALSGVSHGTLTKLIYGTTDQTTGRRRPPSKRIQPDTAQALLALRVGLDNLGATVPVEGTGTRRRLQALIACGWTMSELARRLGRTPSNFTRTVHGAGDGLVAAHTARKVRALYDQLWDVQPPRQGRARAGAYTRAKTYATTRGWAPPLAWDDDTIDDPTATPHTDEPAPRGPQRRVHVDDVEWLIRTGGTYDSITTRLGVTKDAVVQACRRAGRTDLIAQLTQIATDTRRTA